MEYQSMKRKQLQALCKKHGVPANLSTREMADQLSSILEVNKKLISRGESLLKNSSKKVNENDFKAKTKVMKKVRFSPDNQTFFYEASGYNRGGKRRCILKSVPRKQSQATENDVFSPSPVGRKRAKVEVKKQSLEVRSPVDCNVVELGEGNVIGGLVRRQLRNREVVVGKSDGDLVISRKKSIRGGLEMVRNVPEENVTASKDAKLEKISKTWGRITRSRARFESRDSENEEDGGDCEKAPQFEESSKGECRKALMRKSAEADKVLRKRKQDVKNDKACKMLSGNSRKVENVYRITRSPAKTAGEAIAAESKNDEDTVHPEEPSKGVGRNALMRKSAEAEKVLRKRKQDVMNDETCKMLTGNSRKVENVYRITRSRAKTAGEAIAAESKNEEDTVHPKEPSKGVGRNALMRKSAEANKVLQKRKQDVKKDEQGEMSNENSRKVGLVNRITRSQTKTAREACAAESKNEEEIVQPEEFSKAHSKYTLRQKSVVPNMGRVGSKEVRVKKESRKRSRNIDLDGASEVEAILDDSKEAEMVKDDFVPRGHSRRTRRNTATLISTDSTSGELESHNNVGQKSYVTKIIPRRSRRNVADIVTDIAEADKVMQKKETNVIKDQASKILSENPRKFKRANRIIKSQTKLAGKASTAQSETKKKNVQHEEHVVSNVISLETLSSVGGFSPADQLNDSVHGTVDKGRFPYDPALLKTHGEHENDGSPVAFTSDSSKILSTCKDKLLAHSDVQETFKAKVHEDVNNGLEVELQEETLLQFASGELRDGLEGDTPDAGSICGKAFCELTGNCNSVNKTEEQVCVDVCCKESQLDESNAARSSELIFENVYDDADKGVDDKGFNGESYIEQCAGVAKEEISNCALKVELVDKNDREVIGTFNSGNTAEEQVCADICRKDFQLDESNAVRSSKLVLVKVSDDANVVEETNSIIDIIAEDVPFNEDNAAGKGVDDKGFKGESDVEQCADVAKEEILNCAIKVELGDKIDYELIGNCNSVNKTEEQVCADVCCKKSQFDESNAARSSELVFKKVYDDADLVGETNSSVNITAEDVPSNEDNAAGKGVDDKGFNGESDIEQRAGVAKEEISNSALKVELGDKNDREVIGNFNSVNMAEEQVCADICSKDFQLEQSNTGSELVLVKVYDDADLVKGSFDITAADVPFNKHYAANKGIDNNGFNGESDVEQCADVAKEKTPNCALKVELGYKSDHKEVAPEENGSSCTSLTELISKESEVSKEKAVETMIEPVVCIEGVDNLTVKVSKSEDRNSHTVGYYVSALAQVNCNHLVEEEAMEVHDDSVQNIRIAADDETHTVLMEKGETIEESENVETSLPVNPQIPRRTSTDELAEINDSTPRVLKEVIQVNGKDLEESSNEFVGFVPPADEAKFGDLDNYNKQNVLELERSTSVISDNLVSTSGRAAYRKENVGIIAGDLSSNDNSYDAEKEDNVDVIQQITKKDIDDHLPAVKLCNAHDSDHSVVLNYGSSNIGVAEDDSVGKVGSENIEAGTKWLEKTPTFSRAMKSERKHGEKNSSEGRFFADILFDEPEIGSGKDAVDTDTSLKIDDPVAKKITSTDQKDSEDQNDSVHGLNIEDNARIADKQHDDQKCAAIDTGFTDGIACWTSNKLLCSHARSIIEVAAEGTRSNKLCDTENIKELPAVSSLTPRMSADFSGFSPSIDYSKDESKSSEFRIDSPQLTSWEMSMILGSGDQVDVDKSAGGTLEANWTTQDCEVAVQVKENLRTNEPIDQQTTEKHLDEQEHHNHLTVSDKPVCDNEEPNQQHELHAISQEYIYYEIQKDKSNVSPEEVMLIEDAATKSGNIADDLKEAENIAVDPGVFNCSGSKGNSMDKEVHTKSTKKMNTPEVENVGTTLQVTPQELTADCGNTRETLHEISGTVLQQIFRAGSGFNEKFCLKMPEHDVHSEDCNNDAGRKKKADEDIGNNCRDMALLFQEDKEATIENTEAADSFSPEHNLSNSQEVVKDQLNESDAAANEATFGDSIYCSSLSQPSSGNKGKRHVVESEEADELHRLNDRVVATIDFKKVVGFENSVVASTSAAEMVVDCSAVSPVSATSNHGTTSANPISNDAKDVKENVMIVEQLTEEQLSEQKMTVEVSKLNSPLHSDLDLDEPTSNGSKGSTEHKNMLAIIHGTADNKNHAKEPLNFGNKNLAAGRETAGEDPWKLELNLLSPQRSSEAKTRGNTLFAKKLNSSVGKQNNKRALIQRTPKLLGHDRKENFPSTKKEKIGNFTAPKSLSKRRALEDLRR